MIMKNTSLEERTMMQRGYGARDDVGDRPRPEFSPPVDIFDNNEEIVLVADMPGVTGDSVDIHLDRGTLTIRGKVNMPGSDGELVYEEFHVGDFVRTFTLTEDIDPAGIAADLQNGVLNLRLPKAAERKPRKIPVRSG
jgi:HSP20 family molecular chaperone IbpA